MKNTALKQKWEISKVEKINFHDFNSLEEEEVDDDDDDEEEEIENDTNFIFDAILAPDVISKAAEKFLEK